MRLQNKQDIHGVFFHWHSFKLKLIAEGFLVGIISGLLVVFYRFLLEKATIFLRQIYVFQSQNLWFVRVWIPILIIVGYILGVLIKKEKMIRGSGIPQVEGVLLRRLSMDWYRVIIGKFIGGVLAIGAGLSLGREGPSVQIGSAVGQGISRIFKRIKIEEKYLITSGASAGLAAAFNAPLAGVMFALEEVHKHFSPLILTSAMAASLAADYVSRNFFGLRPLFDFHHVAILPLRYYLHLIILGAFLGILGLAFNQALLKTTKLYTKQKLFSIQFRPIIPLLVAGCLGLVLPEVLGGGHHLIVSLTKDNFALGVLVILLVVKFMFTMLSYGCGAPGGIFLPLLTIGALIGSIYGSLMIKLFNMNPEYINILIILAMAGYFTAIVKAPITGIILITELTGSFSGLLPVSIVCITAYIISDVLGGKPIYESLLEMILDNNEDNKFVGDHEKKLLLEIPVRLGTVLDGKKIREVDWPKNCLVVSINRGESEIIPQGSTSICPGDYLIILSDEDKAPMVKKILLKMAEESIFEEQ